MVAADLHVSGLVAGYGPTVVLEDVGFSLPGGQCLGVIGRNGMGKTTLLASLMGLTRRRSGTIRMGGEPLETLPTADRANRGLGYVPQTRDVFARLTVEENCLVALKSRSRAALDEAYTLFPRLAERRRTLAGQLSGGEQQMLSTARALLGRPSVLLMDEPLEGLAPVIGRELMQTLSDRAQAHSMTLVLVEHHLESVLAIADNVLVLERGRVVWHGTPSALRARPQLVEATLGVAALQ